MSCSYCERSCLHKGYGHDSLPKVKNETCPFVKQHNLIQVHIVEQHVEKHLWYHPELQTLEKAQFDLLKMIAPIVAQYECESCIHNVNCLVQEEKI